MTAISPEQVFPDQAAIEQSRAPLMEHLIELRRRLFVCIAALAVGFGIGFAFAGQAFIFLSRPFTVAQAIQAEKSGMHGSTDLLLVLLGVKHVTLDPTRAAHFITTAPLEQFFANVKLAAFVAVVLAFPVIAWQLYRFVAPGLYRQERRAFLPFLLAAPVLFVAGAALVYYVMLPFVMWFSLSTEIHTAGVTASLVPKVSEYLTLVTRLMLAFGLCFQLPVVLTLAGMAGLIEARTLSKFRRFAILGIFILAAVVTPPDPFSQFALGLPLWLLYEASIACVWLAQRRRARPVQRRPAR